MTSFYEAQPCAAARPAIALWWQAWPLVGQVAGLGSFVAAARTSCMKLHLLISLLAAVLLTGCIVLPVPHFTKKSPGIDGRVVDAATGRAVDSAVVQLTNVGDWDRDLRSDATAKTKTEGDFHLGARYNFHLALYAN